jgi:hypothetical protein
MLLQVAVFLQAQADQLEKAQLEDLLAPAP